MHQSSTLSIGMDEHTEVECDRSRWGLTAPANHRRVGTSSAKAIQTSPPCVLTQLASACPCPRVGGGSTSDCGSLRRDN